MSDKAQGAVGAETMTAGQIMTLEKALAYMTPHPTNKGTILLQGITARQAMEVIRAAIPTPAPRTDGEMTAGEGRDQIADRMQRAFPDFSRLNAECAAEAAFPECIATPAHPAGVVPLADGSQVIAHLGPCFHAQPRARDEQSDANWASWSQPHDIYTTNSALCGGGRILVGTLSPEAVLAWQSAAAPVPDSLRGVPEGAIHNGREHLRRLGLYGFTANDGHTLGVRLGVLDPSVACDGPQLLAAMDAYSESLSAPDSTRTGDEGTEEASGLASLADIIERRWANLVGPAMDGGKLGWKRRDLCREFANAVREALTHPLPAGKLPLAATDFAEATWGDVWVENEIDSLREFAAIAARPAAPEAQ